MSRFLGFLKKRLSHTMRFLRELYLIYYYWRNGMIDIPIEDFIITVLSIIYIASPIDFLPDWIPFFGLIDDFIVLIVLLDFLSCYSTLVSKIAELDEEEVDNSDLCVICIEMKKDILFEGISYFCKIFEDCSHVCICEKCNKKSVKILKKCPMCRAVIKKKKKVFL